jgi:hypothetical protein
LRCRFPVLKEAQAEECCTAAYILNMIENMGAVGLKCEKCGLAVDEKGICSGCGVSTRPASDSFNVTYKKFGTSELLEISPRKKETVPPGPVRDKSPEKPGRSRPSPQKPADEGKKNFLVAASAVLIAVLLTGVFFWFFFRR